MSQPQKSSRPALTDDGPFRTRDGRRRIADVAAAKGVALAPGVAEAIDALQAEANAVGDALAARYDAGGIDAEAYFEARCLGTGEWRRKAHALAGAEAVHKLLGPDADPRPPVPDMPEWPYWLRLTIADGPEGRNKKHSFEMMRGLMFLCRHGAYDAIDTAYRRIDTSAVSEVALMSLLRTPFMFRNRLAEWVPFRERVRAEYLARGKPADALLSGLGTPETDPPRHDGVT